MNESPDDVQPESAGATVFLDDCDAEDWERIVSHCEWRRFRAGEEVASEGDTDRSLLILLAGSLEFSLSEGRAQERVVNVIDAPSLVGEVTFFDGRPRSGSLRARADGELLRLPYTAFEALSAERPALARTILLEAGRIVALRLRRVTRLIPG
jgi:CRP-like cAMP-binding protein